MIAWRVCFVCLFALAATTASARDWLQAQAWHRDSTAAALSLGESGSFDDGHLLSPCVAKIGEQCWMWYVGSRGAVAERVFRLGLATSDDGRRFVRHSAEPVSEFADGRRSILTPTLLSTNDGEPLREDGKLRMWFSATDFKDPTGLHTLHEATSEDGVDWSSPSEPQLDNVYAPTVVKDGSRYLLWYTDVSAEPWSIRHAESDDGRNWKVAAKPALVVEQAWEKGRLFYPCVRKIGDEFVMWYGSYWRDQPNKTAIGCAVSRDGATWTKSPRNPVFTPDESRSWESHYTTSESVMQLPDGSWRIWYASRTKPPFVHKYFAIGTALLPGDGP